MSVRNPYLFLCRQNICQPCRRCYIQLDALHEPDSVCSRGYWSGLPTAIDETGPAPDCIGRSAPADAAGLAETPAPAARRGGPAIALPAGAEAACHACSRPGCPNVHVCCGGRVDINIVVPCPDDPPRWQASIILRGQLAVGT